ARHTTPAAAASAILEVFGLAIVIPLHGTSPDALHECSAARFKARCSRFDHRVISRPLQATVGAGHHMLGQLRATKGAMATFGQMITLD
ncbi:MAG: hypothetical protein ACRCUE_01100, partial [Bosea sp. (in: a-proteobacteria)]